MSESAAGKFSELWKGVSKLCDGRALNRVTEQQVSATETSAIRGFQSPHGRYGSARLGLINGESPGDVEPSQDIVWDCTSPKAGPRYHRVVEISDIVNRIAPKDGQQQQSRDAHLLRWIGENPVSSTPDVPKPRARRKSCRQSSVEDLLKLARQFDENMQQDLETDQQQMQRQGEPPSSGKAEDSKGSTWSDSVEAELHALFDGSTQKFSGALSQGFSQEARDKMEAAAATESKSSEESRAAPLAAVNGEQIRCATPQFDDDWEDDDLLNDPDVIAMTQNPLLGVKTPTNTKTQTTLSSGKSSEVQMSTSRLRPSNSGSRPIGIQQLCPRLKTTSRSTFRLGPSSDHQATHSSSTAFTANQSKAVIPELESSTKEPAAAAAAPVAIAAGHATAPDSGMWDSHWDCGDDDQLLYQACDTLERSSGVQAEGEGSSSGGKIWPIEAAANNQSACSRLLRCNSLPETRGWSMLHVGGVSRDGTAPMSQSLPQGRGSVTAGSKASSNSRPAYKRSGSYSAETSNKVFVNGRLQTQAKCSAAEIERKKQEALARRRLRMQNNS